MARGSPDYGVPDYSYFSIETPISDIVTERLGFSRLDNRGRVLFIEDWREGFYRWALFNDSGGALPVHKNTNTYNVSRNGYVYLNPVVTDGVSSITTKMILPVSRKLGIEVNFLPVGNPSQLTFYLGHVINSSITKLSSIRFLEQTMNVQIQAIGGYQNVITGSPASKIQNRATSIKFVIDISTGYYERVMLGNQQYDVSSHQIFNWAAGLEGDTEIAIQVDGGNGIYTGGYNINYVILSGDEP